MALRCLYLGNWTFDRHRKIGYAKICPKVFKVEPVEIHLPLNAVEHFTDSDFDLFGFGTSNVLLACKATRNGSWTVFARAFYRFHDQDKEDPDRSFVSSVFKNLEVFADGTDRYSLQLKNVAQFMEILLDELDPKVWPKPGNGAVRPKGGGSLAKVKYNENRNRKELLERLRRTSSVTLTGKEEEKNSEGSDEDQSSDADYDKLLAEFEAIAKPRISRPPVQKPKRQRGRALFNASKVDRFLDPFCERTLAAKDLKASCAPITRRLPVRSSVMSPSIDFIKPAHMPHSYAPVLLANV